MGLYINNTKIGMPYINSIKYNAYINGNKIWNNILPEDSFSFTVQDNGSFNIPISGINGSYNTYQSFDWKINWGDGNVERVYGTSSSTGDISHNYTDNKNTHNIIIMPNGAATQGWFNAFGSGPQQNDRNNLNKIITVNSQITEKMRTMGAYSHAYLFHYCQELISIPDNFLPATTLADYCYYCMFHVCKKLAALPPNLLPATTLTPNCYGYMFVDCYSIPSIPNNFLPATTLPYDCYQGMFYINSTSAAISLTDIGNINSNWFSRKQTQSYMFRNCTAITTPITYAQIPTAWK